VTHPEHETGGMGEWVETKKPEPADPRGTDGYFPPGSMMRRINQETAILLGSGKAILLQLAHPFVAAGVDDFSNFQSDILKRLHNTLLFMHRLVFEDRPTAQRALRQFHSIHERIRGRLREPAGRFAADTPYSGTDPEAKLWVHATFVSGALQTYQRFITPLTPNESRAYYADSRVMARLMEIPEQIVPATLEEFEEYMTAMLASDTLAVTDRTRRLARAVLYPRVGLLPAASAGLLRFVTAGLLPERFRHEYRLVWGGRQEQTLNALRGSIRHLRPLVPPSVWQTPLLEGKLTRVLLWGRQPPDVSA
jgi:uncharacterized protein (DUF2236 family)